MSNYLISNHAFDILGVDAHLLALTDYLDHVAAIGASKRIVLNSRITLVVHTDLTTGKVGAVLTSDGGRHLVLPAEPYGCTARGFLVLDDGDAAVDFKAIAKLVVDRVTRQLSHSAHVRIS